MKTLRKLFGNLRSHGVVTPLFHQQTLALFAMLGWAPTLAHTIRALFRSIRHGVRLYASVVFALRRVGATWREAFTLPLSILAIAGGGPTWIGDLKNNVVTGVVLNVAAYTASGDGTAIDFISGFGNCFGLLFTGVVTDGTHDLKVQESDVSGSGFADTPGGASFAQLTTAAGDDNKVQIINFKRTKRFLRVNRVTAGTTTGGIYGVFAMQMKKAI